MASQSMRLAAKRSWRDLWRDDISVKCKQTVVEGVTRQDYLFKKFEKNRILLAYNLMT